MSVHPSEHPYCKRCKLPKPLWKCEYEFFLETKKTIVCTGSTPGHMSRSFAKLLLNWLYVLSWKCFRIRKKYICICIYISTINILQVINSRAIEIDDWCWLVVSIEIHTHTHTTLRAAVINLLVKYFYLNMMNLIYRAMFYEKPVCSHKIINGDWGESYRLLEFIGYHFSLVGGLEDKERPCWTAPVKWHSGLRSRLHILVNMCTHTLAQNMHTCIHKTFKTASQHSQNR